MKRLSLLFCMAVLVPVAASAHVTVSPRASKPGSATQRQSTRGCVHTMPRSLPRT